MNGEKKKRIFSAVLSGMIMLTTVLVTVITYQMIGIFTRKNQIEKLDAEISSLKAQIAETEDEIESWTLEWKIIERAYELGMRFDDEE